MAKSGENFLSIIFRWKKTLLIVFIISVLISIVFSGNKFIKPLYRSTAIIYPINMFSYSEESETEQMLQLLTSRDLSFEVIDSLDLYSHYNIQKGALYTNEKVLKKFDNRVSIKRTPYDAVKIDVYDRSPEVAYQIADLIIHTFNKFSLELMRKKARDVLEIKEKLYTDKLVEVDSLKLMVDSLIRNSGLAEYNILRESMRGNFQYLHKKGNPNYSDNAFSEKTLDLFYYQRILENELSILIKYKNDYEIALSDVSKTLIFTDVISAPAVSHKKAHPTRIIIILSSIFTILFLALAIILFFERPESDPTKL